MKRMMVLSSLVVKVVALDSVELTFGRIQNELSVIYEFHSKITGIHPTLSFLEVLSRTTKVRDKDPSGEGLEHVSR